VIPHGQEVRRFEAVRENDISSVKKELGMDRGPALVCVSRLDRWKGHAYLFEAVRILKGEFPDLTLYLAGEGPYRTHLEASVREAGIAGWVTFLGFRKDALEIMAAADAVVHPSISEAFCSVVVEAVMLAKPLVTSEVGIAREIAPYVRIVPPADSGALVEALRTTLANPGDAKRLATAGRAHILESMGASKVAQAHADIYRAVLSRRHGLAA
jgi:glycosyltransferase involved in cell wall biosynthesis